MQHHMDRHWVVIQGLKDMVWNLEECVLELEREKVMLELRLERMSEQLCRCSGASTRTPGNGSLEFPYEVSDSSEAAKDHDIVAPTS